MPLRTLRAPLRAFPTTIGIYTITVAANLVIVRHVGALYALHALSAGHADSRVAHLVANAIATALESSSGVAGARTAALDEMFRAVRHFTYKGDDRSRLAQLDAIEQMFGSATSHQIAVEAHRAYLAKRAGSR